MRRVYRMGDDGMRLVQRCTDFFRCDACMPRYSPPINPFVLHCFWISAKIETDDWLTPQFERVVIEHFIRLGRIHGSAKRVMREMDFDIVETLSWRLTPLSPFLLLHERAIELDKAVLNRANLALERAVIEDVGEIDADPQVAVASAIVAAETWARRRARGGARMCPSLEERERSEAFRVVRVLVACASTAASASAALNSRDVWDGSLRFEELLARCEQPANEGLSSSPVPGEKRARALLGDNSPTSVIPPPKKGSDGGASDGDRPRNADTHA
jgi:hypothetical protein